MKKRQRAEDLCASTSAPSIHLMPASVLIRWTANKEEYLPDVDWDPASRPIAIEPKEKIAKLLQDVTKRLLGPSPKVRD